MFNKLNGKAKSELQDIWMDKTKKEAIKSVFTTVRNRTQKTKGCLNRKTSLAWFSN